MKKTLLVAAILAASGCQVEGGLGTPGGLTDDDIQAQAEQKLNSLNISVDEAATVKQGKIFKSIEQMVVSNDENAYSQIEVTPSDPGAFSVQPTVSKSGSLDFYLNPDYVGEVTLVFTAPTISDQLSFEATLNILPAADIKDLSLASSASIYEDQDTTIPSFIGNLANNIYGPLVVGHSPSGALNSAPIVNSDGSITLSPAPNFFGAIELSTSFQNYPGDPHITTVTVTNVNDAPSFVVGSNIEVEKNSGAHTISDFITIMDMGPFEAEIQSALLFNVGSNNGALFSVPPAIDSSGQLTFELAGGVSGEAVVTVQLKDNGGTDNGGRDSSMLLTFTITVPEPVIDDLVVLPNETVLEDQGAVSISSFVQYTSAITSSDVTYNFNSTVNFDAAPIVTANGELQFAAAPNEFGTLEIEASLNSDPAATRTFTVEILPVNDQPSLTFSGTNQRVSVGSGPQTSSQFFVVDSYGPANESTQTTSGWEVVVEDETLFASLPVVNASGEIEYEFKPAAEGKSNVTVRMIDSGGTANGGNPYSAAYSFSLEAKIMIESFAVAPSGYPKEVNFTWSYGGPGDRLEFHIEESVGMGFNKADINGDGVVDSGDNITIGDSSLIRKLDILYPDILDARNYKLVAYSGVDVVTESDVIDTTAIAYNDLIGIYSSASTNIYTGSSFQFSEDGTYLLVGGSAPTASAPALLYKIDAQGRYQFHQSIEMPAPVSGIETGFGGRSAFHPSGNAFVIAAGQHDDAGYNSGRAFMYKLNSATGFFEFSYQIAPAWVIAYHNFGGTAIKFNSDGSRLVISASGDRYSGYGIDRLTAGSNGAGWSNSGAVWVFELDASVNITDEYSIKSGNVKYSNFGFDLDIDENNVLYVVTKNTAYADKQPALYRYNLNSSPAVSLSSISLPGPELDASSPNEVVKFEVTPDGKFTYFAARDHMIHVINNLTNTIENAYSYEDDFNLTGIGTSMFTGYDLYYRDGRLIAGSRACVEGGVDLPVLCGNPNGGGVVLFDANDSGELLNPKILGPVQSFWASWFSSGVGMAPNGDIFISQPRQSKFFQY